LNVQPYPNKRALNKTIHPLDTPTAYPATNKTKQTNKQTTYLCFLRNHLPVCGKSNPRPRKDLTELIALSTCDNESLLRMPIVDLID